MATGLATVTTISGAGTVMAVISGTGTTIEIVTATETMIATAIMTVTEAVTAMIISAIMILHKSGTVVWNGLESQRFQPVFNCKLSGRGTRLKNICLRREWPGRADDFRTFDLMVL